MKRLHLVEIGDQPWLPASIRDAMTDYLQFAIKVGKPYASVLPLLRDAFQKTHTTQVIDLCSGGGGPWPTMLPDVAEDITVHLTDKFPNTEAFRYLTTESGSRLRFSSQSVDATDVPAELDGFRTLFSAFHHFPPETARCLLQDAVEKGQGIGIFEATQRSAPGLVLMLLTPLIVLLVTPFIRPFRLSRLLWTYLIPVVPLLVPFDGIVSSLRTYSPAELQALVDSLPPSAPPYHWEIGEAKAERGPVPVTYLLGYPEKNSL